MIPRLFLFAWSLAIVACVPVPTPSVVTLQEPPSADLDPLAAGEAIAVLPNREGDSRFVADCVRSNLSEGLSQNRVLSADEARDALFPWLEPGGVPNNDAAVRTFVARPAVAARLRDLRLRYIAVVDLRSTGDVEGAEVLLGGASFGKVSAGATAQVVDLDAACCRSGGTATATGIRGHAHVVIYGFILLSAVEEPACDRLSAALLQKLRPVGSNAP
jgi:hypothetical protein